MFYTCRILRAQTHRSAHCSPIAHLTWHTSEIRSYAKTPYFQWVFLSQGLPTTTCCYFLTTSKAKGGKSSPFLNLIQPIAPRTLADFQHLVNDDSGGCLLSSLSLAAPPPLSSSLFLFLTLFLFFSLFYLPLFSPFGCPNLFFLSFLHSPISSSFFSLLLPFLSFYFPPLLAWALPLYVAKASSQLNFSYFILVLENIRS